MFEKAKIGDKFYSVADRMWFVIKKIEPGDYPIIASSVNDADDTATWDMDGYLHKDDPHPDARWVEPDWKEELNVRQKRMVTGEIKMSIQIKTEKVVVKGDLFRKIINIKGVLKQKELPGEYLLQELSIFSWDTDCGNAILTKSKKGNWNECVLEVSDTLIKEEDFQKRLERIRKAGELLASINKKNKERNASWKGEEIFVI